MSRRWGWVLGWLVTAVFLWLAFKGVDLEELASTLAQANYVLVPVAALFTFLGYTVRARRWQLILAPSKSIAVSRLFPVLVIGFAANNLLPARIGEFVRAYLLGSREGVSKSLSFATVVLERILDGLTLIAILALVSLFFPLTEEMQIVGVVAASIFLLMLFLLLLLLYRQAQMLAIVAKVIKWWPARLTERVVSIANSFVDGVRVLRQTSLFLPLTLLSIGVWFLEAGSYFVLTWALSLPLGLGDRPWAALLVLALANLAILIPSSPGYLGPFDLAAMTALLAFGVNRELALSYAVLSHATQYILITGLGIFFLGQQNLSLARLRAQTQEGEG